LTDYIILPAFRFKTIVTGKNYTGQVLFVA